MTQTDIETILQRGDTQVSCFDLYGSFAGLLPEERGRYRAEVRALVDSMRDINTARSRYVLSVLGVDRDAPTK